MSLPVVTATVRVYNQEYVPGGSKGEFMVYARREVEVLQLNLNSGGMRVRFTDMYDGKTKKVTQDVPISDFYAQFEIVAK
jgi:hypothetical protein